MTSKHKTSYCSDIDINKTKRSAQMGQKPCLVWLTGFSGAGKSTTANALEKKLHEMGKFTYSLDGDHLRTGLNGDLGFSREDKATNIQRAGYVAKLMVDAGLIVIASFISPYRDDRIFVRQLFSSDEFIECHIKTSIKVCQERDKKGIYREVKIGNISGVAGVDAPYEEPLDPEVVVDTSLYTPEQSAEHILNAMKSLNII